jgi:hypothetical protein
VSKRQVGVISRGNLFGVKYREKKLWFFWGAWHDVVDQGNELTWAWLKKDAYERADLAITNGVVDVSTYYDKRVTAIWSRDEESEEP